MTILLQSYTFQFSDTGLILNTDSNSFPFVDVMKVSGLDSAPIRLSQSDHEGLDGGYVDSEFETTRVVVVEGMIYCTPGTEENYLDQLKANYAPSKLVQPFYFSTPDKGTRVVFGKSQGFRYDWDTGRRNGTIQFQLMLLCPDPRIYGASASTAGDTLTTVNTGGRAYNRVYPLSYGGIGSTNFFNCYNAGNRLAPVVFDIFGAVTNPTLINDATGQSMTFAITINGGDYLHIDTLNRQILLNGTASRRSTMTGTSTWIFLAPGANNIRFLGTQAPPTPIASAQGTFRDTWR